MQTSVTRALLKERQVEMGPIFCIQQKRPLNKGGTEPVRKTLHKSAGLVSDCDN